MLKEKYLNELEMVKKKKVRTTISTPEDELCLALFEQLIDVYECTLQGFEKMITRLDELLQEAKRG